MLLSFVTSLFLLLLSKHGWTVVPERLFITLYGSFKLRQLYFRALKRCSLYFAIEMIKTLSFISFQTFYMDRTLKTQYIFALKVLLGRSAVFSFYIFVDFVRSVHVVCSTHVKKDDTRSTTRKRICLHLQFSPTCAYYSYSLGILTFSVRFNSDSRLLVALRCSTCR